MVLLLEEACNVLDIEYPVVDTRREVAKKYNLVALKNHPDKVPDNRKREASNRMSFLSSARDLLFALFERDAWKGTSTPLVCGQNVWNCKASDKSLVSLPVPLHHHCMIMTLIIA